MMQSQNREEDVRVGIDPSQEILESLINRAFDKAKFWAGAVVVLECILYVGGIIAIFYPVATLSYPWIAFPLATLGVWLAAKSSGLRDKAEELKRDYEYLVGFGIGTDTGKLADSLLELPKGLSAGSEELLRLGLRHWSTKPIGPARTLDNLIESAWFTKHLASFWGGILTAVFVVSIIVAVSLLLLCATSLSGTPATEAAAKCIAGTLLFLISVGLFRLCASYRSLAKSAGEADSQANQIVTAGNIDSVEVQRLLSEYQLTRACGPLIPTWAWRLKRDALNTAWQQLKHPKN